MGRILIRNASGNPIPCCWDDCWESADDQCRVEVPHDAPKFPGEKLIYTFCSERHKLMWTQAIKSTRVRGTLPTGSRGLLGPAGIPIG